MASDRIALDDVTRLVGEARAGRMEAFEALVRRYQLDLRLAAARLGLRAGEVDEATQETFVRAFQSLDRYDPARPFAAWLRGILRHVHLKEMERRGREGRARTALIAALSANTDADPSADDEAPRRLRALRACLERLPVRTRQVVTLRFVDQLSLKHIAERLAAASEGTVSKALTRIRAQLAECVRRGLETSR